MAIATDKVVGRVLCEALGLDPTMVRRIVLDVNVEAPVIAHVEMYTDKDVEAVDWGMHLQGASIVRHYRRKPTISTEMEFE